MPSTVTSTTAIAVECRRPRPAAAAASPAAAHDDEAKVSIRTTTRTTVDLVDIAAATATVTGGGSAIAADAAAADDDDHHDDPEEATIATTATTQNREQSPCQNPQSQRQQQQKELTLAESAHQELAEMLERTMTNNTTISSLDLQQSPHMVREKFPPACRSLLQTLAGNRKCLDCASTRDPPEWAAISYGALVCIHCSGRHRALGVAVSQVRSVSMDHWTYREIVCMLEGGNTQLEGFFHRHALTKTEFAQQQKKKMNTKVLHKSSSLPITKTMVDTTKTNPSTTNTESAMEVIRRTLSRDNLLTIKTPILAATTSARGILPASCTASSLTSSTSSSTSASSTASTTSSTSTLTADNITILRYKTKAALFYKNQLEAHVNTLLVDPIQTPYTGRPNTQNTNATNPRRGPNGENNVRRRRNSGTATTSKSTTSRAKEETTRTTPSTAIVGGGSKTDDNPADTSSRPTSVISSIPSSALPSSVVASHSSSPPTTRDSTPIRNNISATTQDGY